MPSLTRTGASSLYQPDGAGPKNRLAFLAAGAAPSIPLDDCWARSGTPKAPGYFVLLDRAADATSAAAIEAYLRTDPNGPNLSLAPAANGIVWLVQGTGGPPKLVAMSLSVLDKAAAPTVAANTIVVDLPGLPILGLGEGAPIVADTDPTSGALAALTVLSRPVEQLGRQPPSAPCVGPGVRIDLSSARAGQLTFSGLIDGPGGGDVRDLVKVLMDPLHPLNSTQTYTGQRYALVQDASGVHLRGVV